MNAKLSFLKIFLSFILLIFSFYINYHYANKGLYPIDTFSFFDSGFYITEGQHPIKDFWIISGVLIDYIQAAFFTLFGKNWNAYVYHASFFNSIITVFFFFFLNQFNKNFLTNILLSTSVAILCYPVVGTPFPYQHSFIISLISLLVFYLGIEKRNSIYWIVLPILMSLSFLSMQVPSGFINLFIIIFLIIYFLFFEKYFLRYFLIGSLISIILFLLYLLIIKVDIIDFFYQIVLFPLSVGEGRILSNESAFESAKLLNKITIRGLLGHFKFINFFIFTNLILIILYYKKKNKKEKIDKTIFLNIFLFFCSLSFIFHQLITANQTFIFSLIPILCGLVILQMKKIDFLKKKRLIQNIFLIIVIFSTFKYHNVYNEKRKFLDLQNVNLNIAIKAKTLDKKFNELSWVTPIYFSNNPKKEIDLLKKSLFILKNDKSEKMLITHYQFFSLILNQNLNIPNRWYFPNNTFPSSYENKYYEHYIKKFKEKIINRGIDTIYILETYPGEFEFLNFDDLIGKKCYQKEEQNQLLLKINLLRC
jgi:hypothetical protein